MLDSDDVGICIARSGLSLKFHLKLADVEHLFCFAWIAA